MVVKARRKLPIGDAILAIINDLDQTDLYDKWAAGRYAANEKRSLISAIYQNTHTKEHRLSLMHFLDAVARIQDHGCVNMISIEYFAGYEPMMTALHEAALLASDE